MDDSFIESVETPLLQPRRLHSDTSTEDVRNSKFHDFTHSPASVLPLSLLSALALASTSATQIYTYAVIICRDPRRCDEDERRKFSASVAIATTAASVCAIFSLRGFEALCKRTTRVGPTIWLAVRSLSVLMLNLGVLTGNIKIAMCSQIFEGLASDNILHFNLNSLYVRAGGNTQISKLIGSSLALYMIGISLSPSIAAVLGDYRDSFVLAYGLFLVAFVYLVVAVRVPPLRPLTPERLLAAEFTERPEQERPKIFLSLLGLVTSHFQFVTEDFRRVPPGLALFFYNMTQSYIFSALMVHTSINFQFSSRENGFLLTIIHVVASLYLLTVLFLIPKIIRKTRAKRQRPPRINGECQERGEALGFNGARRDSLLALVSLLVQTAAVTSVGFAKERWQVYSISILLALGLCCPGFLKSYFAALFEPDKKPQALAYLAVMESCGSLLAPVILGIAQTVFSGGGIFLVGAANLGVSCIILSIGILKDHIPDR
ncbi:hypothetical protein EV127DRAFT_378663 [Xylaria flabelliformis]|nr:hypothetical protein EV127DRAFT_378663 [Xylaria flabelliformis]